MNTPALSRASLLPLIFPALPLAAQTETDSVVRLPEVSVVASADASAAGLSEAYAGEQVATGGRVGLFGSQDYMGTPFNFTSYTRELIENQLSASIGDVLLNDPSVRVARGFGNFQQLYLVRGLPIYSDDMSYNGLYGLLPRQYLAAELVERVEVLRGANAFLNGAAPGGSGLGGAVNVMPKRAPNTPLNQITTGLQTGGQWFASADIARRFAQGRAGVRVNAVHRDGDTAIDGEKTRLGLLAIGLDYRRDALRLSADVGYQDHQRFGSQPSITIGTGLAIPAAPDASRSVGQAWTFSGERDTFGTLRGEVDVGSSVTAWFALGGREGREKATFANPTVISASGDTSTYRFDNAREDSIVTGEAGVRASFTGAGLKHQVTASGAVYALDSKNAYAFSSFTGFSSNLYSPLPVPPPVPDFFTGGRMDAPLVTETVDTSSFAVADAVSALRDQLLVTFGLRYQKIETSSYDYNSGAQLSTYSENAVTPVGGIVYKFSRKLSAYGNYIEGLTKGDTAPATSGTTPVANAGEVLSPYRTKQVEVGLKFDAGRIGGSVSVFETRKPVAGVGTDQVFRILGHQRYRGAELTTFGELRSDLRVLGGVSFLDTDTGGHSAIGAPKLQTNLGAEWLPSFLSGIALDARLIHTTKQFADSANTQTVPSWTRLDAGVRYTFKINADTNVTLRARIENLADRDYWASAGGYPEAGYLTVGTPRTFLLSATVQF
jgi:iron complex outermembrane recepter protein